MAQLSLCPEDRGCAAPTAVRVLDVFTGLAYHRPARPPRTDFARQPIEIPALVLDLLDIPHSIYTA